MFCQSCHMKQTPETPIMLYQVEEKLLCSRCVQLHNVCVSTTADILGTPPDRVISPLFKELSFLLPPQSMANFSTFFEPVKRQILLIAREQALYERGNAIVGVHLNIVRLESFQYLACLSGTIVWSARWEEAVRQQSAPVPVPHTPQPQKEEEEDREREREKEEERPAAGKYPDVGGNGQMSRFKKLVTNQ